MNYDNILVVDLNLSVRSTNALTRAGIRTASELMALKREDLMAMRSIGEQSADEIVGMIDALNKGTEIIIPIPCHDVIDLGTCTPAELKNVNVQELGLSNRSTNALMRSGIETVGDLIGLGSDDLRSIPALGTKSVNEILSKIEELITAGVVGQDVPTGDDAIKARILSIYNDAGFNGFNLDEICEIAGLLPANSIEDVKKAIGALIVEGGLEYVDYRLYRIYDRFVDWIEITDVLQDNERDIIRKRLSGETLEAVGNGYGITRERVRQLQHRGTRKAVKDHVKKTGLKLFDEDYYVHLFRTYRIDRETAEKYLGMSVSDFRYLEFLGIAGGSRPLEHALSDDQVEAGLKLRILNYTNRDKIYADGVWIKREIASLERHVISRYCGDEMSFEDFTTTYNSFLSENDIEHDSDLYITESKAQSRRNNLSLPTSDYVLWKFGSKLRYYDIKARDLEPLYEAINLDSYENTQLSTLKLFNDYPEVMKEYDIRDEYELHNLIKKTLPKGSFHDLQVSRMPTLKFGKPDIQGEILELLMEYCPISQNDFAQILSERYGYDARTIIANFLPPFTEYIHNGKYDVYMKPMPQQRKDALLNALSGDFLFIDEIKEEYRRIFPNGDDSEVNPLTLRDMGFDVLSRYAFRNHQSLEALFTSELTRDDITDLAPFHKRYGYIQTFYGTLNRLRKNLDLIELMPGKAINFRKLEAGGITKNALLDFCAQVYSFTEPGEFFTMKSIREDGFDSPLFEEGFDDYFHTSLLLADDRFTLNSFNGTRIIRNGSGPVTIKDFLCYYMKAHASISIYDMMDDLREYYGCDRVDKTDITYRLEDTPVFYDVYLERLYRTKAEYDREIEYYGGI